MSQKYHLLNPASQPATHIGRYIIRKCVQLTPGKKKSFTREDLFSFMSAQTVRRWGDKETLSASETSCDCISAPLTDVTIFPQVSRFE